MYKLTQPTDLSSVSGLADWLVRELQAVERAFQQTELLHLFDTDVAPAKPRDGMVVYTSAGSWNPGSGKGFYGYYNGAWNLLG